MGKSALLFIFILYSITQTFGQRKLTDTVEQEFKNKNFQEVIALINKKTTEVQHPDSSYTKLMHLKARSFDMIKNHDSSFYVYQNILRRFPDDLTSLLILSERYGAAGYYKQAFELLLQIKKHHPNNHLWATNLAYYNNEAGNYKLAISYADTVLKLTNEVIWTASALNNKSYSFLKLGEFGKAKKFNQRSIDLNPNNSFAFRNKALILIAEKKIDAACDALYQSRKLGGILLTKDLIEESCK